VSGAERATRWSTIAVVAAVAAVAGWVSYEHALAVVRAHGEAGTVAQVYPITVDGLIYSASMVLLDAARRRADAPGLARWLLAAGIAATLAANVAAGLHFGPVGAVVAAWPALALVGSYELLMLIIRSGTKSVTPLRISAPEISRQQTDLAPEIRTAGSDLAPIPDALADAPDPVTVKARLNGHAAKAERLFAADVAAGTVPGIRRIQTQLHVGQPKARLVQAYLRTLTSNQ
jgi:hypothetical protein